MDKQSRAEQLEEKRSYWKRHIESWQETGLSQAEYCRRNNLKHHRLVYWKKRFLGTTTGVSFVGLRLNDLLDIPARPAGAPLCLVIDDQFKIEIRPGFDAHLLRQLIFALRGFA